MGVSADAVTWAYRFFLGREPESQQAIASHLGAKDETHLAQMLIGSPEFRARKPKLALEPTEGLELAGLEVDSAATPAQIEACLRKIKSAWSHLGAVAPHFSVLTDDRFRPDKLPGAVDDFWNSGRVEAEQLLRSLTRHGFSCSGKTCVEYGCGVGRVTTRLSRAFVRVDAYDISAAHLEIARKRAQELDVGNICFHECSSDILGDLEPCDAFYSRLVFQHNPPPIIGELLRKGLGALRPGGIAVFQVPSYISGYSFSLREWLATDHPLDMQMHCLPQARIFELIAHSGCAVLEVREDSAVGVRRRMVSNTFTVRKI